MNYNTNVTYNGDGLTTDFPIPFTYDNQSEIVVTRKFGDTSWTLTSPNVLKLPAPLASGDTLNIRRVTNLSNPSVLFQPGNGVTNTSLNKAIKQLLKGVQEENDLTNALRLDPVLTNTPLTLPNGKTVTIYEKLRREINVLDFGAKGDGSHDDTDAIQAAIDVLRAMPQGTKPVLVFGSDWIGGREFVVTKPLNFTGMRNLSCIVDFRSSVLIGKTTNEPVIDALDSEGLVFYNGCIYGDTTSTPKIGIQLGRAIATSSEPYGRGAANNAMQYMRFVGNFTQACLLNSQSEVFRADKCLFWNGSTVAGAACLVQDGRRKIATYSRYLTITAAANTPGSHNDNLYTNCCFEQISGSGSSNKSAITFIGPSNSCHFVNCSGQCEYGWLVYAELGPFVNSVFDIHGEALNLKNYLAVNTTAGNSEFVDCKFTEYFMFTTGPLITTFGGPGTLSFTSCELSVSNALTNQPLFFPNGTSVHYHGVIKLGDAASAGTYNLSALTSLTGDVFVKGTLSSVTGPTTGAYRIISAYDKGIQHVGNIYAKIGIKEGNGTNITAASTINIPQDGSFFSVMGTTAVSKINVGSWDEGRTITLRANDGFTLTNSYANNLILASTFNMAANNTITLRCSAGKWWEVCRCANALT